MDSLLTTAKVAEVLGVHENTVRSLIKGKRIAYLRIGRHYRFRQSAIEEYVKRFETPATQGAASRLGRRAGL
jgi:excisionase family DNA binding protein